ncbi:substrate-binding domain-containing protein [Pseudovibrio sp. Tun.PSC04-5.I4]|uniref:substrate-binding domain-containing protein n=1 Tax=Pseudovibrio sp. Tun.PSC04-5.I4 TaxID=1798213 RepID=UPI00087F62DE|nr:substrate-binding domain-containing protein [Pseudovibrio sp. Tun.PSC04-5.I4]SDR45487.1 monosaccharide ABC transporter substrate-binding protein, CUT2 family [Pseudovibrio sp. Tun.PSC04-5.I4]
MKQTGLLAAVAAFTMMATAVSADTIGFSSPNFDDNFQTALREAAKSRAEELGHSIQIEDAREDVGMQLSQIQNFIASDVAAIIVAPVSAAATPQITKMAEAADIPLIYVNRRPADLDALGEKAAFVGSDETWSGTLEAFEVCKQAAGTGKAVMLMGILSNEAAVTRSEDVREVLKLSMCNGIELVAEQEAKWQRTEANNVVSNWLSSGLDFDIVFANNDEMALGALQALKAAGVNMEDVLVAGVDATDDALASLGKNELDVTVFQNAKGQATGSVDAAVKAMNGEALPNWINIPFELVTQDNLKSYMSQ